MKGLLISQPNVQAPSDDEDPFADMNDELYSFAVFTSTRIH